MGRSYYNGDSASAYMQVQEEQRYEEEMELKRKELSLKEMELTMKSQSLERLSRQIEELSNAVHRLESKLDGYERTYFNPFLAYIGSDPNYLSSNKR